MTLTLIIKMMDPKGLELWNTKSDLLSRAKKIPRVSRSKRYFRRISRTLDLPVQVRDTDFLAGLLVVVIPITFG